MCSCWWQWLDLNPGGREAAGEADRFALAVWGLADVSAGSDISRPTRSGSFKSQMSWSSAKWQSSPLVRRSPFWSSFLIWSWTLDPELRSCLPSTWHYAFLYLTNGLVSSLDIHFISISSFYCHCIEMQRNFKDYTQRCYNMITTYTSIWHWAVTMHSLLYS